MHSNSDNPATDVPWNAAQAPSCGRNTHRTSEGNANITVLFYEITIEYVYGINVNGKIYKWQIYVPVGILYCIQWKKKPILIGPSNVYSALNWQEVVNNVNHLQYWSRILALSVQVTDSSVDRANDSMISTWYPLISIGLVWFRFKTLTLKPMGPWAGPGPQAVVDSYCSLAWFHSQ